MHHHRSPSNKSSNAYPIVAASSRLRRRFMFSVVVFLLGAGAGFYFGSSTCLSTSTVSVASTGGKATYRGSQYWKEGVTQSVKTIFETSFCRFQVHQVQLGTSRINDWLWYDEPDNVNVLVQHGETGEFWVLEQTKYAINGNTYAVIGGLIELDADEGDPLRAAQRELKEELQMEATEWKRLGNFVAAANRGGGTTHVFWARNARLVPSAAAAAAAPTDGAISRGDRIAEGELERQDVIRLSQPELLEALLAGRFREIKWTATVALALLQGKTEY